MQSPLPSLQWTVYRDGSDGAGRKRSEHSERNGQALRARGLRAGLAAALGGGGVLPGRGALGEAAVLHHDPAAQRHRQAPHRARPPDHAPGPPHPLAADAGLQRPLAARHRPRRHRHPDHGRAPAREPRGRAATTSGASASSSGSGHWKEQYQGNIREQLERLGASCDWTRERFTMDDGPLPRRARGLRPPLRRGAHLPRRVHGQLVPALRHRRLRPRGRDEDGRRASSTTSPIPSTGAASASSSPRPGRRRCWATRRWPSIPDDERYRHLARQARPCCRSWAASSRSSPMRRSDREFGTGVVKVTPSHDPNDFEMGRRHNLPGISVIDRRRPHDGRGAGRTSPASTASRPAPRWSSGLRGEGFLRQDRGPHVTTSATASAAASRSSRWSRRSGS